MKVNESFTGNVLATSTEPSILSDGETLGIDPQALAGSRKL